MAALILGQVRITLVCNAKRKHPNSISSVFIFMPACQVAAVVIGALLHDQQHAAIKGGCYSKCSNWNFFIVP